MKTSSDAENVENPDFEAEDRPIEDLLKLPTYEGCTGSEIEAVISYFEQRAYERGRFDAIGESQRVMMEAQVECFKSQADTANAALMQLIDMGVELEEV